MPKACVREKHSVKDELATGGAGEKVNTTYLRFQSALPDFVLKFSVHIEGKLVDEISITTEGSSW